MRDNPAVHVYLLFGIPIVSGALFVAKEFLFGALFIGIFLLLLHLTSYYASVKQNRFLMKALSVYISICILTGTLEVLGLIPFSVNYTIFVILVIIYLFRLHNTVVSIAEKKANDFERTS
jgi:hypothetical protein